MSVTAASGGYITPPADFPVSWDDAEDARLAWRLDGHVTTAKAPLSFSTTQAVLRGFSHAFARLGLPMQMRVANFNGYIYAAMSPPAAPAGAQKALAIAHRIAPGLVKRLMVRKAAKINQKQLEHIQPILTRFAAYWQDDLLPQNREQLAFFEDAKLSHYDLEQLQVHFGEALQRAERLGKLHALATFPAIVAMSLFEEFYCELFPTATALDALRLLQGFDNQTLRGDRALWQLSRLALTMPTVQEILRTHEPEALMSALAQSDEGRDFLGEFEVYLHQYGRRLNTFAQLSEPSWLEAPVTAVACLQTYLSQPDSNPEVVQARLVVEREQALAEARRQLAGRPPAVISRFESLLAAAQNAPSIKEDNHWILQEFLYQMRRLGLALGDRLQRAGDLPAAEDVFYLTAEELLAGTVPDASERRRRQAARLRFSQVAPPPMLGTTPAVSSIDMGPFFRAIHKADGSSKNPVEAEKAQVVRGTAASAGVTRGAARVIGSLAEAGKLQPGEVLVAKVTTPPWTPLFGVATAVVTDTGGVLSHCAVVAREYGIPAVVGTGNGTQVIRDGQMLEVNGSAGTVRLMPEPESGAGQ